MTPLPLNALEVVRITDGSATGAVARRGGHEVGRVLGRLRDDRYRGRHVWVELDDQGLAPGEDAALYGDLYAVAGAAWVEEGALDHYIDVRPDADVLSAWFALGFGQQQVYAERPTQPTPPPAPAGFSVRRGGVEDLERAASLAEVMLRHHEDAPVWWGIPPPTAEELRSSWAEYLSDDGTAYFIAERDGEALGHLTLVHESPEAVELDVAATRVEDRGSGVGVALTEFALHWAHGEGYLKCVTDWRSANLAASRFWPRRGFRPTAYRLVRFVRP